jgi:3',5'-cyclic-nucleotide phosphodiesterase
MSALHGLARAVDSARPGEALKGLTVVAIHVKPTLEKGVRASRDVIREELAAQNDLGVRFLMPEQGDVLTLSPP